MPEFELDQQTEEEIAEFIDEWFSIAPEIMGISEVIAGCEVTNIDPYGVGVAVFPRYVTARVYEYTVPVLFRGFPTILVNDLVTVMHFREGNRYEVIASSGNTGSSPTITGSGVANQVAYWTGTYVLAGDAGLTYNAATDTLSLANSLTFTGITGVNDITVPDNLADALSLDDVGGINYLQITSTNTQPVVVWNEGGVDIDFRVEGVGAVNALFVQGSDGNIGLGIATPLAQLHTTKGRIVNTTRQIAVYTALITDDAIYGDTDGGAWTLTLPVGVDGQRFFVTNCGSSGNDLTVDGNGVEEINGDLTQILGDGESIIIIFETTEEWRIF